MGNESIGEAAFCGAFGGGFFVFGGECRLGVEEVVAGEDVRFFWSSGRFPFEGLLGLRGCWCCH